jgi:hypothetical protein
LDFWTVNTQLQREKSEKSSQSEKKEGKKPKTKEKKQDTSVSAGAIKAEFYKKFEIVEKLDDKYKITNFIGQNEKK